MLNRITIILGIILIVSFYSPLTFSQSGTLRGTIRNAQTNDPLPYSNIILLQTSIGGSADEEGGYIIRNIPTGSYKVRVSYLGCKQEETTIEILAGKTTEYNALLEPEVLEGETVEVTAQAEGQKQAINEQLSSIPIKNVVSMARIQELPDANAAESVSRLPGVSLIREGGEGSKVVIRGLSPQYNQITIDGVEIASDVASANNLVSTDKNQQDITGLILGDRGTDLSMISSNMLGGISVIKAITPDMDAAVLGGVVNFDMRKAAKTSGRDNDFIPKIDFLSQGRYNQLKDSYKDYKFVGSVEKRFFENKFGVFLQGSTEERNLSANELGVDYDLVDKDHGDVGIPELLRLRVTDIRRIRNRYGGTLIMDYQHSSGDIGFMNFYSRSETNSISREETAQIKSADEQLLYRIGSSESNLNIINNLISIKQEIPFFHVDLKLSHSYSETENPGGATFTFLQRRAELNTSYVRLRPDRLATLISHNAEDAFLYNIENPKSLTEERTYNGAINFQHDFVFSEDISAKIKFGGSYQYKKRSYDLNQTGGSIRYDGGDIVVTAFQREYPWLTTNNEGLSLQNFVYDGYSYGDFLNGDYEMEYPLDAGLMQALVPIALRTKSSTVIGGGYKQNDLATRINDYSGDEIRDAAYLMTTINLFENFMVLPGVRYQNLSTDYTAVRAEQTSGGLSPLRGQPGYDVTIKKSRGYFLPMFHFSYRPNDWFQARFAYTNTLNYPDYSTITPRIFLGTSFISYNNTNLKPARSENFDIVLSVYTNEIGLLSVNGFKKEIKDLIFYSHTYVTDLTPYPELPQRNQLYDFTTYINSPIKVDLLGIEADWQTHFWYLPEPFSGLVFNINYTHIFSEANYPKSVFEVIYQEDGTSTIRIVDTLYTSRLLNQPNDIINLGLGYDYKGFSARVSMLFQDNIFKKPDFWLQNRIHSEKFSRWDLSLKQELPWYGIQLLFNINNVTGESDVDLNEKTSFPASEQHYGMTADLGIRIKL